MYSIDHVVLGTPSFVGLIEYRSGHYSYAYERVAIRHFEQDDGRGESRMKAAKLFYGKIATTYFADRYADCQLNWLGPFVNSFTSFFKL